MSSTVQSGDQYPFDGDNVPRGIIWKEEIWERMFVRMSDWRQWRRDYEQDHEWIKEKQTRGQRAWRLYQDMIQTLLERTFRELMGPPPIFHFKPLDPPEKGLFSMRYNSDIRLVISFFEDDLGRAFVQVEDFGFHYENL